MPRIVREAEIVWEGTTARGAGVVTALSSGAFALPTTIASRVADPEGKTSPEELLAAAHASCYVTSLEHLFETIGPQDAEQNITGKVAFGMEHADYLTMRAPRPTLICAATREPLGVTAQDLRATRQP